MLAILIVHTCILLLMYKFLLYSLLKGTKATGMGEKAYLYVFPCELGDTEEKILQDFIFTVLQKIKLKI